MSSLYNKYRPRKFGEVVGQEAIKLILRNQIKAKKTGNAYLFAGPSGVGKTTTARIFAMALNCQEPRAGEPCLKCQACTASLHGNAWDMIELDAATFRGIDGIRDLQQWAMYSPMTNFKIMLMDEVHQFTEPAWNSLLRLLEEPTGKCTIILCTTEVGKVPTTARSRCQLFEFQTLKRDEIFAKLTFVAKKERLGMAQEAIRFIAAMAEGNLRTAETMLEQAISLDHGSPSTSAVKKFLNTMPRMM